MAEPKDYYAVLSVTRDAPEAVIKASYAALMRSAHPDRTGGDTSMAALLNEARDVLLDPQRRREHDRVLDAAARRAAAASAPPPQAAPSGRPRSHDGSETPSDPEPSDAESWGESRDFGSPPPAAPRPTAPPPTGPPPGPPWAPASGDGWPPASRPDPRPFPQYSPPRRVSRGYAGLWTCRSRIGRYAGWSWACLFLVPLVGIGVSGLTTPKSWTAVGIDAAAWCLLGWWALSAARHRVYRRRIPLRYLAFLALYLLTAYISRQEILGAVLVGAWTLSYLLATEIRRREAWA